MNLSQLNLVLVPVDFSDPSVAALEAAAELVGDRSKLHVLHVLPELNPLDPSVTPDLTETLRTSKARASVHQELEGLGFGDVAVSVAVGDPGHAIVEAAESLHADMVVIASHGYRGFKRVLLGSVAERVVRHAPCPVLVVRRSGSGA